MPGAGDRARSRLRLPYAGLADHHLASTMAGVHPDVAMPLASTLAQRALELDPDLPEAHGMLAIVAGPHALDWQEAERRFRLAMAHEPVPWHVREWYAVFYLLSVGRAEEARREVDRALQDNPLDQITLHAKGSIASGLGLDEEARAAFEKLVALDPQFWWGWCQFGMHCAVRGKHREARECADKAFAIFPSSPLNIGLMAGLCRGEDPARAEALLAQLPSGAYGTAHARTFSHLVQGEIDAALDWAEKAVGDRDPSFIPIAIRTFEKWFCKSPRWPAFLKTIKLAS